MMVLDFDLDLEYIRLELENVGDVKRLVNTALVYNAAEDLYSVDDKFFSTISASNFDMCMVFTRIKTHLPFRSFCSSLAQPTMYES